MSEDNRIQANRSYSVPSAEDRFEIQVAEPEGTDTVVAFFTESKADWLDIKKLTGRGFKQVKEKLSMTRGLKIVSTNLKKNEWESKVIEVRVLK